VIPRLFLLHADLGFAACGARAQSHLGPTWRVVDDVPLPGKAARLDYQSLDPATGWLWIAHMGAGEVLTIDLRTRQVTARVPDMPGATGVRVAASLGWMFAALSAGRQVAILDSRSGRVLARVGCRRF
jgi:hypothetical protein